MTDLVILALVIVAPAAVIANFLLWQRYLQDERRPRSRFFAVMAVGSSMINIGSAAVAFLALRRLLGAPPLEHSAEVTAVALLVVFAVPVFFWFMFIFLPDRRS